MTKQEELLREILDDLHAAVNEHHRHILEIGSYADIDYILHKNALIGGLSEAISLVKSRIYMGPEIVKKYGNI